MIKLLDIACFSCAKPNKLQNEDDFLAPVRDKQSNIVFAISDGVGSYNGAGQASHRAIEAVSLALENPQFRIEDAFAHAKQAINEMTASNANFQHAATTLTVVQVTETNVNIGHIGDCRAYYLCDNKLIQLTKDETRLQQFIDSGEYPRNKLNRHKKELSSILTNAISSEIELQFDIQTHDISKLISDNTLSIVLMSDGAYEHWEKRPRFTANTMQNPLSFSNNLRKRIEKNVSDDYSIVHAKLLLNQTI